MNCDPTSLMAAAKCYRCIPAGALKEVQLYLLCKILSSIGVGFSYTPDTVLLNWTDSNGLHTGNLAAFRSIGNPFTTTTVDITSTAVTTVTGLGSLPALDNYLSSNCALLTTIDMSTLVSLHSGFLTQDCPALTSVLCGSWIPSGGIVYDFSGCALSITSVQLILRRMVLAGVTGAVIDLSGGTNAGKASLNAQGQADCVTLGIQLLINP